MNSVAKYVAGAISRVLKWEVPKTWLSPGVHTPQRIPGRLNAHCLSGFEIKVHVDSCWNAMVLNNFMGDKLQHQHVSKHPVGFTMYSDVHVGHRLEILLFLVAKLQLHSFQI